MPQAGINSDTAGTDRKGQAFDCIQFPAAAQFSKARVVKPPVPSTTTASLRANSPLKQQIHKWDLNGESGAVLD